MFFFHVVPFHYMFSHWQNQVQHTHVIRRSKKCRYFYKLDFHWTDQDIVIWKVHILFNQMIIFKIHYQSSSFFTILKNIFNIQLGIIFYFRNALIFVSVIFFSDTIVSYFLLWKKKKNLIIIILIYNLKWNINSRIMYIKLTRLNVHLSLSCFPASRTQATETFRYRMERS